MTRHIVGFETSSTPVAVALLDARTGSVVERVARVPRERGRVLLPLVEEILEEMGLGVGDIDAYAAGVGPGSYTGVRIGLSLARALAYASGKALRGVASLDVLAASLDDRECDERPLVAAANAYRGELFVARFAPLVGGSGWRDRVEPERCVEPEALLRDLEPGTVAIGDGVDAHAELFRAAGIEVREEVRPRAGALVRLAARDLERSGAQDPLELVPVHLRSTDEEFRKA